MAEDSKKLVWDATGERHYETGLSKGALYPQDNLGNYGKGVVWNGLTGATESPSGAESTDLYADDSKYASLRSAEKLNVTIEAYTYPDEFADCDGSREIAPGVTIGQQDRTPFGLTYRTQYASDTDKEGYKLHILYGCTATPSERGYSTVNDSPEAITFSWELDTNPVNVEGYKPTSVMTITSTKVSKETMKKIEDILYGTDTEEPRLILPDEIIQILAAENKPEEGTESEDETIEG